MYSRDDNLERHYFVWAKSQCPFCVLAKRLLEEEGVEFTFYDLQEEQDLLNEAKNNLKWSTVPIVLEIRSDGTQSFIGGYTDLCEWFKKDPKID